MIQDWEEVVVILNFTTFERDHGAELWQMRNESERDPSRHAEVDESFPGRRIGRRLGGGEDVCSEHGSLDSSRIGFKANRFDIGYFRDRVVGTSQILYSCNGVNYNALSALAMMRCSELAYRPCP